SNRTPGDWARTTTAKRPTPKIAQTVSARPRIVVACNTCSPLARLPDRCWRDGVPPRIAGLPVPLRQRRPVRPRHPVQVVDDLAIPKRQLAGQLLRAVHARAVHVHETEGAL